MTNQTKAIVLAVAALALLSGPTAAVAAPSAQQIREYNTGNSSERVSIIPVLTSVGGGYRVVYCLDLGDAPTAGEILQVSAHLQVTIPHYDTVAFSTQLYLASNCSATGGDEIGEAQGTNFDRVIHHLAVNRTGSMTVPAGNNRRYIVLLAWSASTTAQPGDHLVVDLDYGRLSAIRFTAG